MSCAAGVARLARFNDVSRGTERGLAREVHGDSEGRKSGAQVPWRRCHFVEKSRTIVAPPEEESLKPMMIEPLAALAPSEYI